MIDKEKILSAVNFESFYSRYLPTFKPGSKKNCICPFHDDHNPSLSVDLDKGVWYCHTGCGSGNIFDFYMKHEGVDFPSALKEIADMQGISAPKSKSKVIAAYEYKDAEGNVLYTKKRYEPAFDGIGKKSFAFYHDKDGKEKQKRGGKSVLYNLPAVIESDYIIFVEGEGKADLLNKWGFTATSLDSGANSKWNDEYTDLLKGKEEVIVLPDNDDPGKSYASKIAKELYGKVKELKIVELPGLSEKGDIIDWAKIEGNDKAALYEIINTSPDWTPEKEEDDWEEPVLFGQAETPEIPADILPSWLGAYAKAVSKETQSPMAMAVMLALSTVSTCLQKCFKVSPNGYYFEPLNIWTVCVLPPANRKTAVISAMTAPLINWEEEQCNMMSVEISENEASRAVDFKRIDKLQAEAAKEEDYRERELLKKEIAQLKEKIPEELTAPRLWTGDVTPERLQNLMAENGEQMALLSDEGGIFEIMAGLYSSGRANLDVFLQAHAGASVRVDRGSRTVTMKKPALTFGLAIQPEIISDMSSKGKKVFRGKGLLARFLYVLPKCNIGYRDVTQFNPVPESVKAQYISGIYSLLNVRSACSNNNFEAPGVLTLDKEAHYKWIDFSVYIENCLKNGGELEAIRDWGGKLPGAALRISGLLHVVEYGANNHVINRAIIERSISLCRLLISHAKIAFSLMEDDRATIDAKYILTWILKEGKTEFTQNECHKSSTGRFKKVNQVVEALHILTNRHIISDHKKVSKGRGRPSIIFYVNPKIFNGDN